MTAVRALVGKDVRTLLRAPALLVLLVAYPLLLAGLVAYATRDSGQRPRVAYVDEAHLPATVTVGGARIDYAGLLRQVEQRVDLRPMTADEAARALARGDVVATVTVPDGFVSDLRTMMRSPSIAVATRGGPVGDRALRELEAFVYDLNSRLEREYLAQNVAYLRLLVNGGTTDFLGRQLEILGLNATNGLVQGIHDRSTDPQTRADAERILGFVRDARLALSIADASLEANASPVLLAEKRTGGKAALLENRALALVLGIGVLAVGLVLGAVTLAQERQEHVLPRLLRGRVRLADLLLAKVVVVGLVGAVVGALALGAFLVLGALLDAPTGDALARAPLVLVLLVPGAVAVAAAGLLAGAVGREPAAGALVAVLAAIPFAILGVAASAGAAGLGWLAAAFPLSPLVDGLAGVVYDASPWRALGVGALHLLVLAVAYGGLARVAARRLG